MVVKKERQDVRLRGLDSLFCVQLQAERVSYAVIVMPLARGGRGAAVNTLTQIPKGKRTPGTWQLILVDELGDTPHWSAIVWCPECAKPLNCSNHTIASDGQISPSLGHPSGYPPCSWHEYPKLLEWPDLPAPAPRPFHQCERCGRKSRELGGWAVGWGFPLVCDACMKVLKSEKRP
jgi:hypothetical protein